VRSTPEPADNRCERSSIRRFAVEQRISAFFEITLVALSDNADIDFDAVVGRPASFYLHGGAQNIAPTRSWAGLCKHIQQVAVEDTGLSTYELDAVAGAGGGRGRRAPRRGSGELEAQEDATHHLDAPSVR
jgi:uncharacterized protein involved in type VI secretion and phage assembly